MAGEYYAFEEVLTELQVDEEELKRLVSQGELRCFRDGTGMKFKKEDVINLKKGRETEPTIILTDSDQALGVSESSDELLLDETSTEETVLNIGDFVEVDSDSHTEEITFDTSDDLLVTPTDIDSEAIIPTVEVPALEESSIGLEDSGVGETMIDIGGPTELETESFELMDEDEEEMAEEIAPTTSGSHRISRSTRMRAMQMRQRQGHLPWTIILLVTALLGLVPTAVLLAAGRGVSPEWVMSISDNTNGIVRSVMGMFL